MALTIMNARRHGAGAFALATLLAAGSAFANDYTVQFTATAPTIDGAIDSVWASASAPATGFVDYANVGTASNQQSRVRMLWDASKLYVLFEADDNEIIAPATANDVGFDFGSPQDTAEIFLDPALVQTHGANSDRLYHIAVNPAAGAYTWTEAGQNQTAWNLGPDSSLSFAPATGGWIVEMAIAWTDLNSTQTLSPGQILGPPHNGVIWGLQLGRLHGGGSPANNTVASKWEPTASSFRNRPFGLMKFAGGPAPAKVDLSEKQVTYSNGWEAPTFTAGSTPVGIDGWSSASPPQWFNISNSTVLSGSQSLEGVAGTGASLIGSKRVDNTTTSQYLQYAVRLPGELVGNGYRHVLYINGNYGNPAAPSNGVATQIWFNANNGAGTNNIDVYNYENADGSSTTTATGIRFPGLQAYDAWTWVTAKINPEEGTFEVWINDQKLVRPDGKDYFSVRNKDSFLQFTFNQFYNKNFGTQSVFFDDLIYVQDAVANSGVEDWQLF